MIPPNKKGKIKRAQHRAFAHQKVSQSYSLYSEVLTRSPFQYAEKGNRAYAHLAGVYEIVMATPAYQEAIKQGKTRHEAAEIALADPNIYRAAQTHGAGGLTLRLTQTQTAYSAHPYIAGH